MYDLFIKEPTGFILTLVTAAVGCVALFIYYKQTRDLKRQAAQSLYSEISTAENRLDPTKKLFFASANPAVESIPLMKYESWSKYRYLFY